MKISGAMPVHNEEKYLPYSLASLLDSSLDELVIVLDRCTDKSEQIVRRFIRKAPFEVKVISVKKHKWQFHTAEVFNVGFKNTTGNIIYCIAADIYYNPEIFKINWKDLDFALFPYADFSIYGSTVDKLQGNWIRFCKIVIRTLYPKLSKKPNLSVLRAFRKSLLNVIPLIDVPSEDTWFNRQAYERGYKWKYFSNLVSLHLRPTTISAKHKQLQLGARRAKMNYPFWKVTGQSVAFIQPYLFKGYISEKHKSASTRALSS